MIEVLCAKATPGSLNVVILPPGRRNSYSGTHCRHQVGFEKVRHQARLTPVAVVMTNLQPLFTTAILIQMRFEKIWIDQCRATKGIKRRFGAESALDYLTREKLVTFADQADQHPEFARELPKFQAAVWRVFNQFELAGYVASRKPKERKQLRRLLYPV